MRAGRPRCRQPRRPQRPCVRRAARSPGAASHVTTTGSCNASVKYFESKSSCSRCDTTTILGAPAAQPLPRGAPGTPGARGPGRSPRRPRCSPGDHDIGQRAQQPEQLLIGRASEPARAPVDGRRAVCARDHVGAQPRGVRRVVVGVDQLNGVDRVGQQSANRHGHSQSAGEDRDRLGRQRHTAPRSNSTSADARSTELASIFSTIGRVARFTATMVGHDAGPPATARPRRSRLRTGSKRPSRGRVGSAAAR